ncbi:hypothetical protein [Pseudomonas sichuanensis]|uniref:DUF4145 domain-containing protein n=1 Tax=Pseudomonas sichuanensis TaxID=2213015 RepID=A0ABV0DHE5_9PSED
MNSAIEAIGLIIDGSRRLEQQLRDVGAIGSGLKELSESITASLSPGDAARIRRVYVLRNKVAHDTFEVDQAALAQFLADVEHLLAELKPDEDPDTAMRKRIRNADVMDDEMHEWLKKEAAKRMDAQRASAAEAARAPGSPPIDQPVPVLTGSATTFSESPMGKQLKSSAKEATLKVALGALASLIK